MECAMTWAKYIPNPKKKFSKIFRELQKQCQFPNQSTLKYFKDGCVQRFQKKIEDEKESIEYEIEGLWQNWSKQKQHYSRTDPKNVKKEKLQQSIDFCEEFIANYQDRIKDIDETQYYMKEQLRKYMVSMNPQIAQFHALLQSCVKSRKYMPFFLKYCSIKIQQEIKSRSTQEEVEKNKNAIGQTKIPASVTGAQQANPKVEPNNQILVKYPKPEESKPEREIRPVEEPSPGTERKQEQTQTLSSQSIKVPMFVKSQKFKPKLTAKNKSKNLRQRRSDYSTIFYKENISHIYQNEIDNKVDQIQPHSVDQKQDHQEGIVSKQINKIESIQTSQVFRQQNIKPIFAQSYAQKTESISVTKTDEYEIHQRSLETAAREKHSETGAGEEYKSIARTQPVINKSTNLNKKPGFVSPQSIESRNDTSVFSREQKQQQNMIFYPDHKKLHDTYPDINAKLRQGLYHRRKLYYQVMKNVEIKVQNKKNKQLGMVQPISMTIEPKESSSQLQIAQMNGRLIQAQKKPATNYHHKNQKHFLYDISLYSNMQTKLQLRSVQIQTNTNEQNIESKSKSDRRPRRKGRSLGEFSQAAFNPREQKSESQFKRSQIRKGWQLSSRKKSNTYEENTVLELLHSRKL